MAVATGRIQTIEGKKVLVVERTPPLEPSLDKLLGAMWAITVRNDITPAGARVSCEQLREHRFATLREGRHFGLDGELRDLRVQMCQDCGAVCVRDISFDRMAGLPVGRRGPLRRDLVLGWYAGARRNQRVFIGPK